MAEPACSTSIVFSHAFQPIVDIDEGKIVSYEALLRGKNQESPLTVFSQVDKQHFMDFDQQSREQGIALAASLGLSCCLSLNFTPGEILFAHGAYVERTIRVAEQHNIHAHQLIIEITESEAIQDVRLLSEIINKLRRSGIVVSIDDFGAGHAGLSLLADIQPDQVKIDMHLIRNVNNNGPRQTIVKAINNICLDLGIEVLAEGVESQEEFTFLERAGISLFQGWFIAKPAFESLPLTFDLAPNNSSRAILPLS